MKRTFIGLALLALLTLGAVASATVGASKTACCPTCSDCTSGCCAGK